MGANYSKEHVNMAQTSIAAGIVETKLNHYGIMLVSIAIIMGLMLCYALRLQCKRKAKSWLRREVTHVISVPPVIKVQPDPPQAQSVPREQYIVC